MEAKFLFRPCASIAPSLESRVGRGHEKSTIENDQKRNRVTELAEITNDGRNRKGMGNDERGRRRARRRAKGKRRRITKESDWRQKEGETKAKSLHFENYPATPRSHVRVA